MTAPTKIHLDDGTTADASDMTCDGCGQPLATHTCGGETKVITVANRSGAGATHKPKALRDKCPHCQGVMHFNESATATNATCMQRQWLLDTKVISDPVNDRLPPLTFEDTGRMYEWGKKLKTPMTYGKMLTASGVGGTYSSNRPKKIEAAKAGEKIEDMAATIELPEASPAAPKKGRSRTTETTASVPLIENEELFEELEDLEEPVAVQVPAPEVTEAPKRGRGRPRKGSVQPTASVPTPVAPAAPVAEDEYDTAEAAEAVAQAEEITQRRGRGRPRKIEAVYIPETAPVAAANGQDIQDKRNLTREERHALREEKKRKAMEALGKANR